MSKEKKSITLFLLSDKIEVILSLVILAFIISTEFLEKKV